MEDPIGADHLDRVDDAPGDGTRRVDRVVGLYMAAAVLWIVVSSLFAGRIAELTTLPIAVVEVLKGLAFVLATGLVLRSALRRWAARIETAAELERRAVDDLRELSRLRGQFVQSVSHELRTPLTSIIGYGVTMQKNLHRLDPGQLDQLTGRLVANARRLEGLVLDLLDLDRIMQGDDRVAREELRVDHLVKDVLARVPHDGYAVAVETPALVVHLDRVKTERIVQELVRNAVRHTPAGTRVRVASRREGDSVRLSVSDDGPGLDPELRDAMFEPFTQGSDAAESATPGLGIGLALVRRYVELQGGTVTIVTERGGGTRFDVRLPVDGAEPTG